MPSFEKGSTCDVCGAIPDGVHYGVRSCRSCKVFFRRTIRFDLEYECSRGGECDVRGANRVGCRFCRYQMCIRMGMRRYASKRNTDSPHSDTSDSSLELVATPPPFSPTNMLSHTIGKLTNIKFQDGYLDNFDEATRMLAQLSMMPLPAYLEFGAKNYNSIINYFRLFHQEMKQAVIRRLCESDSDRAIEEAHLESPNNIGLFKLADVRILFQQLKAYLGTAITVLKICPVFNSISQEDKIFLIRRYAMLSVLTTTIITTLPAAGDFLVLLDGLHVLERNSTNNPLINEFVGDMLDNVIPQIRELCMDEKEITVLRTLMAWAPVSLEGFSDQPGKEKGYRIQQLLLVCLKNYTEERLKRGDLGGFVGTSGLRYAKLLTLLGSLEAAAKRLRSCIHAVCVMNPDTRDPLIMELFSESTILQQVQTIEPEIDVETIESSDNQDFVQRIRPSEAYYNTLAAAIV